MDEQGISRPLRALESAVLEYLLKNPDATDSAEGIRRWWLPQSCADFSMTQLEQVLLLMLREKLLQQHGGGPLVPVYGLNKNAISQIKTRLGIADSENVESADR